MNYTQAQAIEEIERYANDNNAEHRAIYDFGVRREWLTDNVIEFAKNKGIRIVANSISVQFIKEAK